MIIKAKLVPATGAIIDLVEPVLVPKDERELVIKLESDFYDLNEVFVVTAKNGKKMIQKQMRGQVFDLSSLCFAGSVMAEIGLVKAGEIVKHWIVPPIVLKEHSAGFEAFNGYTELLDRVAELERKTSVIL
jgi:hypothetical protein